MGIVGWTAVKIFGPIGQALAKRIAGDGQESHLHERRLDALAGQVEDLRHQLAETHERLDFTERLLAQERSPGQLHRGAGD